MRGRPSYVAGFFCLWFNVFTAQAQNAVAVSDLNPEEVLALQAALRFVGHEIGEITGIYGNQTTQSVEAFEFSIGMGNEGWLDEDERDLLDAQVTAMSYEKFGYRLRGYWSPVACHEDMAYDKGIWLNDLALLNREEAIPLIEMKPKTPMTLNIEGTHLSLTSTYLESYGEEPEVLLFPLHDRMIAVLQGQAMTLSLCENSLEKMPK